MLSGTLTARQRQMRGARGDLVAPQAPPVLVVLDQLLGEVGLFAEQLNSGAIGSANARSARRRNVQPSVILRSAIRRWRLAMSQEQPARTSHRLAPLELVGVVTDQQVERPDLRPVAQASTRPSQRPLTASSAPCRSVFLKRGGALVSCHALKRGKRIFKQLSRRPCH